MDARAVRRQGRTRPPLPLLHSYAVRKGLGAGLRRQERRTRRLELAPRVGGIVNRYHGIGGGQLIETTIITGAAGGAPAAAEYFLMSPDVALPNAYVIGVGGPASDMVPGENLKFEWNQAGAQRGLIIRNRGAGGTGALAVNRAALPGGTYVAGFSGDVDVQWGYVQAEAFRMPRSAAHTIVGGILTPIQTYYGFIPVNGAGGVADDLDGVANGVDGMMHRLRRNGEDITVKHNALGAGNADNILCIGNADFVLGDEQDFVDLIYSSDIGAGSWLATYGGGDGGSGAKSPGSHHRQNWRLAHELGLTYQDENRESQTLAAGENNLHSLIYVAERDELWGSPQVTPGKTIRFNNPDDLSDYDVITYSNDGEHMNPKQTVYLDGYIYVLFGVGGRTVIARINPVDMTYNEDWVNTNVQNAGTSGSMCTDGLNLYVISYTTPAVIYRWTQAGAMDASEIIVGYNSGHSIESDTSKVYATGQGVPAWVASAPLDLSAHAVATVGADTGLGDDTALVGDYVWCAVESPSDGDVVRILKSNLATQYRFNLGHSDPHYGVFYDGRDVWALAASSPGTLYRINPDTFDVSLVTLASGENNPNEIATDGQRLFITCWQSPAKLIRVGIPQGDSRHSVLMDRLIGNKSTETIDGNDEIPVPTTTWLYLTSATGTDNLVGIGAGVEGQRVWLTPAAGKDITLIHNSGATVAGQPLMINGEVDVLLDQDHDMVVAVYDPTAAVWNVLVPGSVAGEVLCQLDDTAVGANKGRAHMGFACTAVGLFARLGADANFAATANHTYEIFLNGVSLGTVVVALGTTYQQGALAPVVAIAATDRITIDKNAGPDEGTIVQAGVVLVKSA